MITCGGESSPLLSLLTPRPRIDPTGEFSRQRQLSWLFWTYLKCTSEIIKQELHFVLKASESKIKKLQQASDVQIGMEILHYFVLDLLGR